VSEMQGFGGGILQCMIYPTTSTDTHCTYDAKYAVRLRPVAVIPVLKMEIAGSVGAKGQSYIVHHVVYEQCLRLWRN